MPENKDLYFRKSLFIWYLIKSRTSQFIAGLFQIEKAYDTIKFK